MPAERPPEITCIHQLMAPWVASTPDAPAVRDAHLALTYAQLDAAARDAQAHLLGLGLRPGDRLLVVGENCVALCVLVLAASRMDVWSVVANARLSDREVDLFIDHARPRRVVYTPHVSPEAARHAERHGARSQTWPGLGDLPVGALNTTTVPEPCFADPREQVGCVLYTSGTSGAPKGVMLTHANMLFTATSAARMREPEPGDLSYGVLPMAHIVGLTAQFMGNLWGGAARRGAGTGATLHAGRDRPHAARRRRLRVHGRARDDGQDAGLVTRDRHAADRATTAPDDRGRFAHDAVAEGRGRVRPAAGQRLRLDRMRTPGGADAHRRTPQRLRSPGLMKGCYRSPELTAQVIDAEGWFDTGDRVRTEPDGALTIAGRSKELIIRSGLNVYPVEVEQAINARPEAVQSALVGRTVDSNEQVVAFVERAAGSALDRAALRAHLCDHLAPGAHAPST